MNVLSFNLCALRISLFRILTFSSSSTKSILIPSTLRVVLNISITLDVYALGIASIDFLLLSLKASLIRSFRPITEVLYKL